MTSAPEDLERHWRRLNLILGFAIVFILGMIAGMKLERWVQQKRDQQASPELVSPWALESKESQLER